MEHKRVIEVFTAGCPVCAPTVALVKSIACSSCDVVVYDLSEPCDTQVCVAKMKEYGIKSLPAVTVNGVLLDSFQHKTVIGDEMPATGLETPAFI